MVLFDGAARSVKSAPRLHGPIYVLRNNKWHEYTDEEKKHDRAHVNNRALIECYFGRLKNLCPILQHYTGKRLNFSPLFRACVVITNIQMCIEAPLRREHLCEYASCYYCTHIKGDKTFDTKLVECGPALNAQ